MYRSAISGSTLVLASFLVWAGNPVANNDSFTVVEGTPAFLDLIANDYDEDGDPLTVSIVMPNVNTCWGERLTDLIINNGDGSIIVETPDDINGNCSFSYRLVNGGTAQVTLNLIAKSVYLPLIDTQPQAFEVALGGTASFGVGATSTEPLEYQWQKNGVDLVDDGRIAGALTADLSISGVTRDDIAVYRCRVFNQYNEALSNYAGLMLITDQSAQAPFSGVPFAVPSVMEAEHYDFGAEGAAFSDTTAGNGGEVYRTGGIDFAIDASFGAYATDWVAGEWLAFSVAIPATGQYDLGAWVAGDTSNDVQFHWETENGTVLSCDQRLIASGGPEDWVKVEAGGVTLTAGTQALRLVADSHGWNLDRCEIEASPTTPVREPYNVTPFDILSTAIEIEHYDRGGRNLTYYDATPGNSGNHCGRAPDWVDLGEFVSGTVYATDIQNGEWLEYTLSIPTTSLYDLTVRYKADQDAALQLSLAGIPTTVITVPLPARPDFGPVTITDNLLQAGNKIARISFTNATGKGLQVNKFEFANSQSYPIRVTQGTTPIQNGEVITFPAPTNVNQARTLTYQLHNDHPSVALHVDQASITGPGWTMTVPPPTTVPPASSVEFTVRLLSATPVASTTGTVSIETSGASAESFSFQLQDSVIVALTEISFEFFSPNTGGYEPLTPNTTLFMPMEQTNPVQGFYLQNTGSNPLSAQLSLNNNRFTANATQFNLNPSGGQTVFQIQLTNPQDGVNQVDVQLSGNFPNSPIAFKLYKVQIVGDPVTIVSQPQSINIPIGGSGQLQVAANGGAGSGFDYQWVGPMLLAPGPIDPDDTTDNYTGSDTPTLNLQNADTLNSGAHYCLVSDKIVPQNAAASIQAYVTVYEPITLTQQSGNVHVAPGGNAQFSVVAAGASGNRAYQWEFKGLSGAWTAIANNYIYTGATTTQLQVNGVGSAQVGEYRCRVYQPGIPENVVYSSPASLSILHFTAHPADAWGFAGESATMRVTADGGGRTLSYTWFVNGQAVPGAAGPTYEAHFRQATETVFCDVSDGIHTLRSNNALLIGARRGLLVGDSFNRGNTGRQALNGVLTPFGLRTWQASGNLVYFDGDALNNATAAGDNIASVTVVPKPDKRLILGVDVGFGPNPPSGSWFGFGFSPNGASFTGNGQVWVKLTPATVSGVDYIVYANGTQQVASGHISAPAPRWTLEYNPYFQTVSMANGGKPLVSGAGLPVGFNPSIARAQFMFHCGGTNGAANGGDFALSTFELYEHRIFLPVDDFTAVDVTQGSVLIDVLANDHGEELTISGYEWYPLAAGSVNTDFIDGREQTRYYPDPNYTGETYFLYTLGTYASQDYGYARATLLCYQGFGFVARPDEIVATPTGYTEFDPTVNDFHSESAPMVLSTTDPFPSQPSHGTVQSIDGVRVRYTPNPGYLGKDSFTYRIADPQGRTAVGTVNIYTNRRFDGSWSDSFANVGAGRHVGGRVDGVAGQSGDFSWAEFDKVPDRPFLFGSGELQNDLNSPYWTNYGSVRLHENLEELLGLAVADDFESGTLSKWSLNDAAGLLSVTGTGPIAGAKSLRVGFNGTNTVRMVSQTFASSLRTRVELRMSDGAMTMAVGDRFQVLRLRGNAGVLLYLFIHQLAGERQLYFEVLDNDGVFHRSPPHILTGTPIDLVLEWVADSAGLARMIVNEQTRYEVASFANHNHNATVVDLGAVGADAGTGGAYLADKVSVHPQRDIVMRTTFALPANADASDSATLAWLRYTDGVQKFNDGLYLDVSANGNASLIQRMSGQPAFVMGSASVPLGAGQAILAELWYHPQSRSVSAWVNGRVVAEEVPLNRQGFLETWHKLGFYGLGSPGTPNRTLRILDFEVDGTSTPPTELEDRVIYDSFTGANGSRANLHTTDVGNRVWYATDDVTLLNNHLTTDTVNRAFGVRFDPTHYQGQVVEASADINFSSQAWLGFGFISSPYWGFGGLGELWVQFLASGVYRVYAKGNAYLLANGTVPNLVSGALNHVKLRYDRSANSAELFVNGRLLTTVSLNGVGYTPRIAYCGAHVVTPQAAGSPYIDNFAIALDDGTPTPVGQTVPLLYEDFLGSNGNVLHGRLPRLGWPSWEADGGVAITDYSASITTNVAQSAGIPFLPADYAGSTYVIEADSLIGDGHWVGVGFSKVRGLVGNGALWANLNRFGQWTVFENGTAVAVASGTLSGFNLNQHYRLQLWWNPAANTASFYIDGQAKVINAALSASYYPNVQYAGFEMTPIPGASAPGMRADNFRLGTDNATPTAFASLVSEVYDGFSPYGSINGTVTQQGNRTWNAHPYLQRNQYLYQGQQRYVLNLFQYNGSVGNVSGFVNFDAGQYGGNLFAIESELLMGSANYLDLGFLSLIGGFGQYGQVWIRYLPSGRVELHGVGGALLFATNMPKVFNPDLFAFNKFTIIYNRQTNKASLLVNDVFEAKDIPVSGTPNVLFGGMTWYRNNGTRLQVPQDTKADEFTIYIED